MTETTAKSPCSSLVRFMPYNDYHWGFLGTTPARIGVSLQNDPQPNLMFYPPVHVPEGAIDDFLDRCVANHHADGDSLWLAFSIDPADGEVSLRINLMEDAQDDLDNALADARSFFETRYPALLRACSGSTVDATANDDDDFDEFLTFESTTWVDD